MKIVAIGGGNLSLDNPDKPYNLSKVNSTIVELSNKAHPRLLYLGFNIRADYYFSYIKKIFAEMGCQCTYLRFNEFDNEKTVESKFKRADILFLPGGNTLGYMKQIKKFGLGKYIKECAVRNVVMAGISAGAIILFAAGSSDARKYNNENKYTKVKGLNIMPGIIAPHFSSSGRILDMQRMLKTCNKNTIAFGIDECAALVIDDDNYKVVCEDKTNNVFKCYYLKNEYKKIKLEMAGTIEDLYQI